MLSVLTPKYPDFIKFNSHEEVIGNLVILAFIVVSHFLVTE